MDPMQRPDKLISYDAWGNLEAARSTQQLPTIPERARKLIAHIIGAEWNWLARMKHEKANIAIWPDIDPAEWEQHLSDLHTAWRTYLRAAAEDELTRSVQYTNSKGEPFSNTVSDILMHVVLHSAHHRGQIASLVRELGGQPAITDYIAYVRR